MLKEDFDQWRNGPVGVWFFDRVLTQEIDLRDKSIGSGSALSSDPYETLRAYSEQVGITAGIEFTRQLDPFKEERNETKSSRSSSPD